jgi:putative ABC transport system permease protein
LHLVTIATEPRRFGYILDVGVAIPMWRVAVKNLWRRPARSVLTAIGLAVAVAAVVSLVGISDSLESSFLEIYTRQGADLVVQRRGGASQLAKGIELAFGDEIRRIPGVRQVVSGLMDMVSFEEQDLLIVIVNGWEVTSPVLDRVNLLTGRRLRAGDRRAVMLGRILAANLGKKTGGRVQLYGQDFDIVGVFESFSVYENGAVFMLLDELQRQTDRAGEVTGFVVKSIDRRPETIQRIRRQIEDMNPAIAATPCAEFVGSLTQMKVARTMSRFTSLFAIAIGTVGVMNAMAMSIFERRGEIAALRAMGWQKKRVAALLVSESVYLSLIGAAIGVILGIAIITLLAHSQRTSGLIQGDISPRAILEGIVVALAIALAGAALPAYRCLRLPIGVTIHEI